MENYATTLDLLRSDGSVTVNKALIHSIGLNETIIFCELLSRYNYFDGKSQLDKDGYFFNTVIDLQAGTGLGEKTQRKAIQNLKSQKLIDYKLKGLPSKRYFKIIANNTHLMELIKKGKAKMQSLKSLQYNKILQSGGTNISELEDLESPVERTNNTNINNTNCNNTNKTIINNSKIFDFSQYDNCVGEENINQIFFYYLSKYKEKTGNSHPYLKKEQKNKVLHKLLDYFDNWNISVGEAIRMIDHFYDHVRETDYNINHFAASGMLDNIGFHYKTTYSQKEDCRI